MFVHQDPSFGALLAIAARTSGLTEAIVEKDYWVTHALWGLTQSPLDMWFKGGTSLSKGFGLIQRFSEDLDLKLAPGPATKIPTATNWTSQGTTASGEREAFFRAMALHIAVPDMTTVGPHSVHDQSFRNVTFELDYPGQYLAALPASMRQNVLLELGEARVLPCVQRDMTSWVHQELQSLGQLSNYTDNRPFGVNIVHPLVTLIEKLDAIQRKWPNANSSAATFVRHIEDAVMIVRGAGALPRMTGYAKVADLANDMLQQGQIKALPDAMHEAFTMTPGPRLADVEAAWRAIHPMYWDPNQRVDLTTCCSVISNWIRAEFL